MSQNLTSISCQDYLSTCYNGRAGLHYQPSGIGNAIFLVVFMLCLLGQIYILIFKRLWGYTVFLGTAFFLEILGYVAKIQLRSNQHNSSAYIMQVPRELGALVCLTRSQVHYLPHSRPKLPQRRAFCLSFTLHVRTWQTILDHTPECHLLGLYSCRLCVIVRHRCRGISRSDIRP